MALFSTTSGLNQLAKAADIVRGLATRGPYFDQETGDCVFCATYEEGDRFASGEYLRHGDGCLWRLAVEWTPDGAPHETARG